MARVRIGAAARLVGVSKSTMHRALKAGRVSYETDQHGVRWVDPSELARVFPDTGDLFQRYEPRHAETHGSDTALAREVELLRERLADKDAQLDDLRRRLDQSEEERRQLSQRLLPDRRPWWRRWQR